MKKALIVGGANGIGLAIAHSLALRQEVETISIVDRVKLDEKYYNDKFVTYVFDLENPDYSFFNQFDDIDTLIITAGFGKLSLFENLDDGYITSSFNVNTVAPIKIIKHFYSKIKGTNPFYCGVMVSIAGFMSSPFFSVYAATKAALKIFIESVNVELIKSGTNNQILNVSPGSIKGTTFNKGENNLLITASLAEEIIRHLDNHDDLFIPEYETIFKDVLTRYMNDFRAEGSHSYEYKKNSGRI